MVTNRPRNAVPPNLSRTPTISCTTITQPLFVLRRPVIRLSAADRCQISRAEHVITERELEEYGALRATIRQRGTARPWALSAGFSAWTVGRGDDGRLPAAPHNPSAAAARDHSRSCLRCTWEWSGWAAICRPSTKTTRANGVQTATCRHETDQSFTPVFSQAAVCTPTGAAGRTGASRACRPRRGLTSCFSCRSSWPARPPSGSPPRTSKARASYGRTTAGVAEHTEQTVLLGTRRLLR